MKWRTTQAVFAAALVGAALNAALVLGTFAARASVEQLATGLIERAACNWLRRHAPCDRATARSILVGLAGPLKELARSTRLAGATAGAARGRRRPV